MQEYRADRSRFRGLASDPRIMGARTCNSTLRTFVKSKHVDHRIVVILGMLTDLEFVGVLRGSANKTEVSECVRST
jgi:hypothetical protein